MRESKMWIWDRVGTFELPSSLTKKLNNSHYQHEFNENPMKCSGKAHESFFMAMNIAIVTDFMALIYGYKFSMNYITVFFTTHEKIFSWPPKFHRVINLSVMYLQNILISWNCMSCDRLTTYFYFWRFKTFHGFLHYFPMFHGNFMAHEYRIRKYITDKLFTLWNFGGRIMSGFKVIEAREPRKPLPRLRYA